ncbi:hypothetical protein [Arenimonas maotaiensis]|uniref:hypothetical protein n=1 Tax=Arenimonas maotaiensis TaxID=1446479 RepID=UPI0016690B0D|nr:hypothetical protein [Arenimonas maotaiensis]
MAAAGLASAFAAQAQSGFEYLGSRQFSCRLDTPHAEAHFVQFAFGPGNTVTGKMGIAVWLDGTPYTQVYDVTGRTDRFGENTYKVYIENYTRVSSDALPGDYFWHYRSLDEFTLYTANGNRLTGRHTTVSPSTANNASTRATYDSTCSEHNRG